MEIVVLRWVLLGFFVLIGVLALLSLIGFPKRFSPGFRKWAVVGFCAGVISNVTWLLKPPQAAVEVPLIPPDGTGPGPDLIEGDYSAGKKRGRVLVGVKEGGYVAIIPPGAIQANSIPVTLTFRDSSHASWQVKQFFPTYNAQPLVPGGPTALLEPPAHPAPRAGPTLALAGLPAIESGTLKGFPNPPAMVRGGQSPPAPHAPIARADAKAAVRFDNYAKRLEERRGHTFYDWRIFVDEPPAVLDTIAGVDYLLHPTFPNPRRTSQDRDRQFEILGSGWGEFRVQITIRFVDGREAKTTYHLDLGKSWPTR